MSQRYKTRINGLVLTGSTVSVANETGTTQKVQVQVDPFRTLDCPSYQFFGVASSMPTGSDVSMLCLAGDNSQPLVVGTNHASYRPTGMNSGETMLYDVNSQTIYLSKGGIMLTSPQQITLTAPVVNVSQALIVGNGATGSFSTPEGNIVTVQDGIITNITD